MMILKQWVICFVVSFLWGAVVTAGESIDSTSVCVPSCPTCKAELAHDRLTLENSLIRRCFTWNEGNLITESIEDRVTGRIFKTKGGRPDCVFPGTTDKATGGRMSAVHCPATLVTPEHLEAEVVYSLDSLEVKRVFRIYPDCPAIACDTYLRGKADPKWKAEQTSKTKIFDIIGSSTKEVVAPVIDWIALPGRHWRFKAVEFYDLTDRYNTLVQETKQLAYPYRVSYLRGNLLFVDSILEDSGLFILKESPTFYEQLDYPGFDFGARQGRIDVLGVGMSPDELSADQWIRCYGVVVGVTSGGELGRYTALRRYQNQIRMLREDRDEMVMMNTWGDHNMGKNINEAFILRELDAAAKLGISHYQIDAGWQETDDVFDPGQLKINTQRFPNGFATVVARAKELGIELCLWTAPGMDFTYAGWKDFADTYIGFYKDYGIRTFKFDMVQIHDKTSEVRLRNLLDTVMQATDYQAVMNLDITSTHRFGYHYFNEYGNYLVEGRYTNKGRYYPHYTLRNLWMLSRYVPAQSMQFEFLNIWRDIDQYAPDDPLAPSKIPFEYSFAVTMMSQPLAWFEATGLCQEGFKLADVIKTYRQHQWAIHQGMILPIGDEPCGTSWTGFQSISGDHGYILVFREKNDQPNAPLALWGLAGKTVQCKRILGQASDFVATADDHSRIVFHLPDPFTYALYAYSVK